MFTLDDTLDFSLDDLGEVIPACSSAWLRILETTHLITDPQSFDCWYDCVTPVLAYSFVRAKHGMFRAYLCVFEDLGPTWVVDAPVEGLLMEYHFGSKPELGEPVKGFCDGYIYDEARQPYELSSQNFDVLYIDSISH